MLLKYFLVLANLSVGKSFAGEPFTHISSTKFNNHFKEDLARSKVSFLKISSNLP